MKQFLRIAKFAISNFSPLIVFYGVNHFYGLRPAIVAAIGISILEIVYMLFKKIQFTSFFKFSVAVTVIFGVLDLMVKTPIFFRYESVITNIITGVYFGMTIWASKSFIQEWIEKKNGTPMSDQNAILRSRILTVVWTVYFFIKAGFYYYVNSRYSLEEALLIRSTVGSASFYGLLAVSIFFGSKIIKFFQKQGMLPLYQEL